MNIVRKDRARVACMRERRQLSPALLGRAMVLIETVCHVHSDVPPIVRGAAFVHLTGTPFEPDVRVECDHPSCHDGLYSEPGTIDTVEHGRSDWNIRIETTFSREKLPCYRKGVTLPRYRGSTL